MGAKAPFSEEKLEILYPERNTYFEKFSAAADRMVNARWISSDDGEAMKRGVEKPQASK
jgi:hypothetical protein